MSVASVLGDVSSYVGSSERIDGSSVTGWGGSPDDASSEERGRGGDDRDDEEEMPSEVYLPVGVVSCKAGTTLFDAPLLPNR